MSRFGSIGTQYFDDAGDPLEDGLIEFTEPNDPNTPKTTYSDLTLETANPNPVVLSAAGRQPNIFFEGQARAVLMNADGVQIEIRDPVGGEDVDTAFSVWNVQAVYNIPDIVVGSDGNFYLSIVDSNEGNDPTATPAAWTQVRFVRVWNVNEQYETGAVVEGSDELLYTSRVNANTGNDPVGDDTNWQPAALDNIPPVIRAAAKTYAYLNL